MEGFSEELIVRYLSGTTTDSERERVNSWIAESAEHMRFMEECYFLWEASRKVQIHKTIDTSRALSALKATIKVKEGKEKRKNFLQFYLNWIQRIAAILLIPVLLFSYYLYRSSKVIADQYIEVKTNPGVITSVVLPDSTKVWINASSCLKYPARFTDGKRRVFLEGEGYFEVTENKHQPFFVETDNNLSVKVIGTQFNVNAYSEDQKIETTLVEGSVNLIIDDNTIHNKQYQLKPNQKATFEKGKLTLQWVDPIYEIGWREGKMYFKNHPMEEVLKKLSRHYNVSFEVKNPEVLQSLLTGKFESEQLLQIMEYLQVASGIKYSIHETSISGDRLDKMIIELTK